MFGRVGRFMRLIVSCASQQLHQVRTYTAGGVKSQLETGNNQVSVVVWPHSSTCRPVDSVCTLIQQGLLSKDLLDALNLRVVSQDVIQVLKRTKNADAAACFFAWAKERCVGKLGNAAYARLIQILADADRLDGIWIVVKDMRADGRDISDFIFWTLIRKYVKAGRVQEAAETVKRIHVYGCKPTTAMCNFVINALYSHGSREIAEQLYEGMPELACMPDSYTHCIRIDNLTKVGDVDAACQAFQAMDEQGFPPNSLANKTLIGCLGRAGQWERAMKLFDEVRSKGLDVDVVLYSDLLHSLARAGELGALHKLYKQMTDSAIQPTVYTYTGLVNGFIISNSVHENWAFLLSLVNDCHPSEREADFDLLLHILIGLCKAQKVYLAWAFLKEVRSAERQTHVECFSTIFHAFLRADDIDSALNVLDELPSVGGRSVEAMYNATITCLGKKGRGCDARKVLPRMKQNNCTPSVITYTLVIDALGKAGELFGAREIFHHMAENGCCPNNYTFNVLLNNLTKAGSVSEAYELFQEMPQPDTFSYNILINGFSKVGKVDVSCRLFDEMKARGCIPDMITFNNLLAAFVKAGQKTRAWDMLNEIAGSGSLPNKITRQILEKAHAENQEYGELLEVCIRMQQQSGVKSARACDALG